MILGQPFSPSLGFEELMPSDSLLWETLGYGSSSPSEEVLAMIDQVKSDLCQMGSPEIFMTMFEGSVKDEDSLCLGPALIHPGKMIVKRYEGCQYYLLALATVGRKVDEWLHSPRLNADIMESFVADTLCGLIAEDFVRWIREYVLRLVSCDGWKLSGCFSPGYGRWALSEQQVLFNLMGDCGISLDPSSFLMTPVKSVSTVIGIGKEVKEAVSKCQFCNLIHCRRRKII